MADAAAPHRPLASRAADQLGLDPTRIAGTGPAGAVTLADVLRTAGRAAPRSRGRSGEGRRVRIEAAFDAQPVRDALSALAGVTAEPPHLIDLVIRICATVLREFPEVAGGEGEPGGADGSESPAVVVSGEGGTAVIRSGERAGLEAIRAVARPIRGGSGSTGSPEGTDGTAFVIHVADESRPTEEDGTGRAILSIAERSDSIRLDLDLDSGRVATQTGEAFLARLRALCLDPRRALL